MQSPGTETDTGTVRAPHRYGPLAWDRIAAGACLLVSIPFEVFAEVTHASWAAHPLLRWFGILAACAALLWRRTRFPLAAVVILVATALSAKFAALFFLAYAAGRYQRRSYAWWFGAAATSELIAVGALGSGPPLVQDSSPAGVALLTAAVAMTVMVGITRARHLAERARAEEVARERAAEAVNAERRRLVREFHDLLGHDVALLNILIEALRGSVGGRNEAADGLLDAAQKQCAAATDHLRGMTAVLRLRELDAPPATGPGPRPGTAELDALGRSLDSVRAAGVDVRLTDGFAEAFGRLPAAHQEAARRVVTEGLTNILRYAPGAAVRISLRTGPAGPANWTLDVRNGPPGAPVRSLAPGTGLGQVGLRGRLEALGGTLEAGPTADGDADGGDGDGYLLRARVTPTHEGGEQCSAL
ncbi:histidine kinase [Streptomyces sp. NPDC006450]|uniref:sensor histidine kinase n=1 Tax=Streptomyces sp. NPDC006450 TaxID=3155458 RepID=UPI0033BFB380